MNETKEQIKCLCLFSGGLDSQLAVCVMREQGIIVSGVCFESPFFDARRAIVAAEQLGITLHVCSFTLDIVSLLYRPKHGFGAGLNPCIDCHALMMRRAGEMMEETGSRFICTGEVLGERPMSQHREALAIVARESGYDGLILRPLSAQFLPETEVERKGWVDRSKLLALRGRSRKPQLQLAEWYGLRDFPTPSGGCRLTEPGFVTRLRDLKKHEGLNGVRNIQLLLVGRHLRLSENLKLIVGRNEQDNAALENAVELDDLIFMVENAPGPTALLPFTANEDRIRQAAAICARYSDCPRNEPATVSVRSALGARHIKIMPAISEEADKLRI